MKQSIKWEAPSSYLYHSRSYRGVMADGRTLGINQRRYRSGDRNLRGYTTTFAWIQVYPADGGAATASLTLEGSQRYLTLREVKALAVKLAG